MRKLFMLVTMLLVPTLASAWTMAVKVTNTTAGITAGNGTTLKVGAGAEVPWAVGTKYLYPKNDSDPNDLVVTPEKVAVVVAKKARATVALTGASMPPDTTPAETYATYLFPANESKTIQNLSIAYSSAATAEKRNVALTQTPNGLTSLSIGSSSTTTGYTNVPVGTLVTVKAQPNTGSTLTGITVTGSTLLPDNTFVVEDNTTVVAAYKKADIISATLSLPTSGQIGTPVTASVAASGAENLKYAWNGAAPGSANTYTFTPAAGANPVTVVVSGTDAASVTRSATIQGVDLVIAANYACTSCHAGSTPAVIADYNTGKHGSPAVTCVSCHTSTPHTTPPTAHNNIDTAVANACAGCHTNTAPHYGGTAFLEAQYVSSASLPVSCTNCHGQAVSTTANQAILAQFALSAHGSPDAEAWRHFDWRSSSRSTCQRCHAGTAFVARLGNENSTTNAYQATDILKPGEVLNCSACHTDAGTGAIRPAAQQFTISMTNAATVTYDVAGASTLCARCHGGRETGDSIKADPGTTGIRGFIDSHYQPAAGTLYNKAGYEYAGQVYDSLGKHKLLGATGQGPCVTCHMPGKNHSFVAASCGTCHNGVTAPVVSASNLKSTYDAALNSLKLALEAKGIYYGPVHPFFFTAPYVAGGPNTAFTNWGSVHGTEAWKETMGAAFNYNLLWSEKGAFAHNYDYAMKLIADSIDFLDDGTVGP